MGAVVLLGFLNLAQSNYTVALVLQEEEVNRQIIVGRVQSWDVALGIVDSTYNYKDSVINAHVILPRYRVIQTELSSLDETSAEHSFDTLFYAYPR